MSNEGEGKFKSFFKKATADLKKFGTEMAEEATKLATDAEKQKSLKDGFMGAAKATVNAASKALSPVMNKVEGGVKKVVGTTPGMNPELYEQAESARVMTDTGPGKYAHLEVEADGPKAAPKPNTSRFADPSPKTSDTNPNAEPVEAAPAPTPPDATPPDAAPKAAAPAPKPRPQPTKKTMGPPGQPAKRPPTKVPAKTMGKARPKDTQSDE